MAILETDNSSQKQFIQVFSYFGIHDVLLSVFKVYLAYTLLHYKDVLLQLPGSTFQKHL